MKILSMKIKKKTCQKLNLFEHLKKQWAKDLCLLPLALSKNYKKKKISMRLNRSCSIR